MEITTDLLKPKTVLNQFKPENIDMKNSFEELVEMVTQIFPINKVEYYGEQTEKVDVFYKSGLVLRLHSKNLHYKFRLVKTRLRK